MVILRFDFFGEKTKTEGGERQRGKDKYRLYLTKKKRVSDAHTVRIE